MVRFFTILYKFFEMLLFDPVTYRLISILIMYEAY